MFVNCDASGNATIQGPFHHKIQAADGIDLVAHDVPPADVMKPILHSIRRQLFL